MAMLLAWMKIADARMCADDWRARRRRRRCGLYAKAMARGLAEPVSLLRTQRTRPSLSVGRSAFESCTVQAIVRSTCRPSGSGSSLCAAATQDGLNHSSLPGRCTGCAQLDERQPSRLADIEEDYIPRLPKRLPHLC